MTLTDWLTEFDDVFVHEENEAQTVDGSGFPYPDTMSQNGGVISGSKGVFHQDLDSDEFINRRMNKVLGCGSTALALEGVKTLSRYYRFIHCYEWFCSECGKKNGRIHNKRIKGVMDKLKGIADSIEEDLLQQFDIRQLVFTLPEQWRSRFMTRKGINALIRIVERIVKEEFPGLPSIMYFHPFGDKDKGSVFKPHVNIHVIEEKGKKLILSKEALNRMKEKFYKALVHYGCSKEELGIQTVKEAVLHMNVFYSFVTGNKTGMKFHKLKYMCRTNPGYIHYNSLKKDSDLKALFMGSKEKGGMQGFQYVRYFNGFKKSGEKDIDRQAEIEECENLAGESLRVVRDRGGYIVYKTKAEIEVLHKEKDMEELSEGFYRVNEHRKKERRKEKCRENQKHSINACLLTMQ